MRDIGGSRPDHSESTALPSSKTPEPAPVDESVIPDSEIDALRAVVEGTAAAVGDQFFQSLVRNLSKATGAKFAFVAQFIPPSRARALAFWDGQKLGENLEWDLKGTPCEEVIFGGRCHHPTGVQSEFPGDEMLGQLGIDSYLGIPLLDADGTTMGHLAIMHSGPLHAEPRVMFYFRIFAARASAELSRLSMEARLRESEQRYRDLFEEAPIAYVHEGLDSRFISANRSAMRILGMTPEQVPGTYGLSFVPDTPEAQQRVKEAFESVGRGTDTSGVVLELRRRDNGKPIWIQWWSRPDLDGKSTRTMFLDITDRVLMEQEKARLQAQNLYLQEEIKSVHNFEEIVGRSPALQSVLENVQRVAGTDASVLITGETGTGKELIARAIHSSSKRHDKPLIKLNCAALPSGLVESELFGHEKGAFSGAIARRVGRFELAHTGTIFLDEIGELSLDVQAKLLRVLQEREFERVGGETPIKADVRIIAATNRDLASAMKEGKFREDLYFRINVFPIHLPPLRERGDDVALLVKFFVKKFSARVGKPIDSIPGDILGRLRTYRWPGNVRELENVLERAVILSRGTTLEVPDAALAGVAAVSVSSSAAPTKPSSLEGLEREHILNVLHQTRWVIEGPQGAAKILDLHPNTLRSRLKKLNITRPAHEGS